VRVASEAGAIEVVVAIGDEVPEGVALMPKGRWGGNVNVLTTARRSDMGDSTAIHGTLVRVDPL
jgi:predicted molibdopterin-dependent oxidoreductase YjgC